MCCFGGIILQGIPQLLLRCFGGAQMDEETVTMDGQGSIGTGL